MNQRWVTKIEHLQKLIAIVYGVGIAIILVLCVAGPEFSTTKPVPTAFILLAALTTFYHVYVCSRALREPRQSVQIMSTAMQLPAFRAVLGSDADALYPLLRKFALITVGAGLACGLLGLYLKLHGGHSLLPWVLVLLSLVHYLAARKSLHIAAQHIADS